MSCAHPEVLDIWKPSRLLDVSIRGPNGTQGVRLCDGLFADPLSEYVTLSHCWGQAKTTRLHKKTLAALRQGVAASNLSKTFAHAASVTLQLGYRYLWIDALCIMQVGVASRLDQRTTGHGTDANLGGAGR